MIITIDTSKNSLTVQSGNGGHGDSAQISCWLQGVATSEYGFDFYVQVAKNREPSFYTTLRGLMNEEGILRV
jgi:hypothetical protein